VSVSTTLTTALGTSGLVSALTACTPYANTRDSAMKGSVQHLSPDGLHKNPAYSQAIAVTGPVRTVYVGGQNAVDSAGSIVGKGDIRAQTERAGTADSRGFS
jgi:hypothetical protein